MQRLSNEDSLTCFLFSQASNTPSDLSYFFFFFLFLDKKRGKIQKNTLYLPLRINNR